MISPELITILLIILLIFTLWIVAALIEGLDVEAFVGCAESVNCSDSLIAWDRKNGGVDYYSTLPQNSEEYWHSFCTDFPDKCK